MGERGFGRLVEGEQLLYESDHLSSTSEPVVEEEKLSPDLHTQTTLRTCTQTHVNNLKYEINLGFPFLLSEGLAAF